MKFGERGAKLLKRVENTVGKGEIARSVFKRLEMQTRKNQGLFSESVKTYRNILNKFHKFGSGLNLHKEYENDSLKCHLKDDLRPNRETHPPPRQKERKNGSVTMI